jgi:hypothetical protein
MRQGLIVAALLALGASAVQAQAPAGIDAALKAAHDKYKNIKEGKNADYIPALAKVDPNIYGIALVTVDGKVHTVGDVTSEVSIQSISKVFTLAKVIEEQGPEAIEKTIGVDATGMRFNSIVAVEMAQKALGGPEMNSLVNPGAIATTSMVKGADRAAIWNSILSYYSDFAGRPLKVNQEVFKSESDTNQRNKAIGARAVLGERERQGSRHHGGDACQRWQEPGDQEAGDEEPERARSACSHGDCGTVRRFGKMALSHRFARQEWRRRRPHRRLARQVRHCGDLTAARRRRQQRARPEGDRRRLECARR